jgi:hypothetical protein
MEHDEGNRADDQYRRQSDHCKNTGTHGISGLAIPSIPVRLNACDGLNVVAQFQARPITKIRSGTKAFMVNKAFTRARRACDAGPFHAAGWGWIMRCIVVTCSTFFSCLGALLCLSAPAHAELLVNISKSQQRLSVTIDGTETYRWPVSTGRRGHATPAGKFRPVRLERHWYSHEYGMTPMPWAVFFHRGYAVHGTMEAYNLGHAASHGCVRLRPDNASILFSLVRREGTRNTKIVILNGPLPAAPEAKPMADMPKVKAEAKADVKAGAMEHFAEALDDKTLDDGDTPQHVSARPHRDAAIYRSSTGSGEARILRERQAWLHSLDVKYGIAR